MTPEGEKSARNRDKMYLYSSQIDEVKNQKPIKYRLSELVANVKKWICRKTSQK